VHGFKESSPNRLTLKYTGLIFSIGSHLFKIIMQIYVYEVSQSYKAKLEVM